MKEDLMLKCLIAFILGWLASRMMGNGFRVGGDFGDWFEDMWEKCPDGTDFPCDMDDDDSGMEGMN